MKTLLLGIAIVVVAVVGYSRYEQRHGRSAVDVLTHVSGQDAKTDAAMACDGRIYCSQMTSCEEATYFLEHCPGTKMDGDHDGIPCERQWCTNP